MGEIIMDYFCDVSLAISNHAKDYKTTQGYTVGADDKQVVVALDSKVSVDEKNGKFLVFSASGSYEEVSSKKGLGHGNGCTYYNGYYYIVKGGGGIESPRILQLDKNFNLYRRYDCMRYDSDQKKDVPQNVSSITHLSGNFFIVAKGEHAFVCKRYSTDNSDTAGWFKVFSSFKMDDGGKVKNAFGDNFECLSQSIFFSKKDYSLYRIASYRNYKHLDDKFDRAGSILRNSISKFSLSGGGPSYNSAKLEAIYKNTRIDIKRFEIEAMSAYGDGSQYISVDIEDEKGHECDAIFKIILK